MQVKHECLIGMLEVYNESITDLLCPESTHLQIRKDTEHGTHVESLSQWPVHAGVALTLLLSRTSDARVFLVRSSPVQNIFPVIACCTHVQSMLAIKACTAMMFLCHLDWGFDSPRPLSHSIMLVASAYIYSPFATGP